MDNAVDGIDGISVTELNTEEAKKYFQELGIDGLAVNQGFDLIDIANDSVSSAKQHEQVYNLAMKEKRFDFAAKSAVKSADGYAAASGHYLTAAEKLEQGVDTFYNSRASEVRERHKQMSSYNKLIGFVGGLYFYSAVFAKKSATMYLSAKEAVNKFVATSKNNLVAINQMRPVNAAINAGFASVKSLIGKVSFLVDQQIDAGRNKVNDAVNKSREFVDNTVITGKNKVDAVLASFSKTTSDFFNAVERERVEREMQVAKRDETDLLYNAALKDFGVRAPDSENLKKGILTNVDVADMISDSLVGLYEESVRKNGSDDKTSEAIKSKLMFVSSVVSGFANINNFNKDGARFAEISNSINEKIHIQVPRLQALPLAKPKFL